MRITVFTPTYNRAYRLEKLYKSLQSQTFKDFEWVVVDDGSTDNTQDLFSSFMAQNNSFDINYIKTENGGKHRAINRGVSEARGELFYIVDSDDYLPDDALETIDTIEKTIPEQEKCNFGGVCGQKGFEGGNAIGNSFEGETIDITTLQREEYKIYGDKSEVFYTSIMRKYPFPEFDGEKFVTECVVWDKIAFDGYKLRFFNKVTMICEYLPDGLTACGNDLFKNNPKAWGLYIHQSALFGKIKGMRKWNEYLDYFYIMRDKISFLEISRNLCKSPIILWLRLIGMRIFYRLYR